MSDSVRQFKRRAQVVIGKAGRGLLVENLRITFEVTKTVDAAPNMGIVKIYNLAPGNEEKIKNEYDEILINCGYEGALRLVFRGNIKHVYRYREGNDYITEIEAADGDKDYRNAVMNETLAAGTTNTQLIERAASSFKGGTSMGYVESGQKTRLRGRVISGNTRDVLSELARDDGSNWSIQDGALTIVKATSLLPNEAIVLNSETGLLGAPEINDKGITTKCLLNPQIRVNGAIKLDNNGIKAKRKKVGKTAKTGEEVIDDDSAKGEPIRLDPDGIYKAIKVIHKGDTRGGDWQTEALSISLDSPIPKKK